MGHGARHIPAELDSGNGDETDHACRYSFEEALF